jgi:hypothetical protein
MAHNEALLRHPPVTLDAVQRATVEAAIRGTCDVRGWALSEIAVRTNPVVSAPCTPERVRSAFKANATREMRENGCWARKYGPWSRGGSRRYLWTERSVNRAIEYVRDEQGGPLPDF